MNKAQSKYFNTAAKMNEALIASLQSKSFEYITVSEICQRAGVNRSTFYLHYENTRDLLDETTRRILDGFLAYFPAEAEQPAARFATCALTELNYITADYLHPFLSYIKENRQLFSTALTHGTAFGFEGIFQRMFHNIFDPILARFHYPEDHRQYVMRFYLNGIMAIVELWLREDCEKSIEEVSSIVHSCIFGRGGEIAALLPNEDN